MSDGMRDFVLPSAALGKDQSNDRQAAMWLPIETAPKDGEAIDLWVVEVFVRHPDANSGMRVTDAKWRDGKWKKYDSSFSWEPVEEEISGGSRYATHWMRVPAPPSDQPQTENTTFPMTSESEEGGQHNV